MVMKRVCILLGLLLPGIQLFSQQEDVLFLDLQSKIDTLAAPYDSINGQIFQYTQKMAEIYRYKVEKDSLKMIELRKQNLESEQWAERINKYWLLISILLFILMLSFLIWLLYSLRRAKRWKNKTKTLEQTHAIKEMNQKSDWEEKYLQVSIEYEKIKEDYNNILLQKQKKEAEWESLKEKRENDFLQRDEQMNSKISDLERENQNLKNEVQQQRTQMDTQQKEIESHLQKLEQEKQELQKELENIMKIINHITRGGRE